MWRVDIKPVSDIFRLAERYLLHIYIYKIYRVEGRKFLGRGAQGLMHDEILF